MSVSFFRTVFNVGADTHVDNLDASEQVVLDGTSKWSCKIAVNGKCNINGVKREIIINLCPVNFM